MLIKSLKSLPYSCLVPRWDTNSRSWENEGLRALHCLSKVPTGKAVIEEALRRLCSTNDHVVERCLAYDVCSIEETSPYRGGCTLMRVLWSYVVRQSTSRGWGTLLLIQRI